MLENTTSDDVIKIIDHMKDIITPIGAEVYKIYYKQMLYSGIVGVAVDLSIIIGTLILIKYIISRKEKIEKLSSWVYSNDMQFPSWVIGIIICAIIGFLFFLSVVALQEDFMHVVNPDYYIIQNLLNG